MSYSVRNKKLIFSVNGKSLVTNRQVLALGIPLVISNLTTPLLGMVDTAVMGHLPSPAYLGALTIGSLIFDFVFWGFGFLRMGTVGFSAQAMGAEDKNEQCASLIRPLFVALAIGLAIILLQWPILQGSLWVMGASHEVQKLTEIYLEIRIWSAPFVLVNFAFIGWFVGRGRTRTTLLIQVLINLVNIALNLWFVFGLGMTVEGVAYATVIAEFSGFCLSAIMAFISFKKIGYSGKWADLIDPERMLLMAKVNRDIFIRTACLLLSFVFFNKLSILQGDLILAANGVLMQLVMAAAYALDAFAHVAEILTGKAKGSRNQKLFDDAVKRSSFWSLGAAVALALAYALGSDYFIRIFTDIPEVIATANSYLIWAAILPLAAFGCYQLDGVFIGTSETGPMRRAMLQSLMAFAFFAVLLSDRWRNHGLWLALTILHLARSLTLLRYYGALRASIAPGRHEEEALSLVGKQPPC